jgi:hypothetical protein
MKIKNMLFIITATLISLAVLPLKVNAEEFTESNIVVIDNMDKYESVDAVASKSVVSTSSDDIKTYYLKLNLKSDSWVYFAGNYSNNNHNGAGTDVSIYSNSSMTNKVGSYGWGYWRYTKSYSDFLSAGTYYLSVSTNWENYDDFKGNVNVMAVAVPISKIFKVTTKVSKNKSSATISITNVLGEYLDYVECQKGSIPLSKADDSSYWSYEVITDYWGGNTKVKTITPSGEKYSYKATTNGKYTFMIQTTSGKRYSKTVTVKGIDNTKPTVTGVKNGKKYKKAVTIKFKDNKNGSGIKKATLNGKKIKSGKKVSKKGKYTLVVKDKAGNKKTIKFTIK